MLEEIGSQRRIYVHVFTHVCVTYISSSYIADTRKPQQYKECIGFFFRPVIFLRLYNWVPLVWLLYFSLCFDHCCRRPLCHHPQECTRNTLTLWLPYPTVDPHSAADLCVLLSVIPGLEKQTWTLGSSFTTLIYYSIITCRTELH
jgi:hypothetical protein